MGMSLRFEIFPADLDATADFYTRVLRCDITDDRRGEAEPYIAFRRDDVRVGALRDMGEAHGSERRPPVGVELVLEVDDVDAELARVRASGWPVTEDLAERPWGLRDFRILDPSGYYLRVTNRTPRQP
jgi:predicted enzyme related to lactoylglutathione lyase